jgi:hypothetical protein
MGLLLPYSFTDIKEEPEDRVGTVGSRDKSRKISWVGHNSTSGKDETCIRRMRPLGRHKSTWKDKSNKSVP